MHTLQCHRWVIVLVVAGLLGIVPSAWAKTLHLERQLRCIHSTQCSLEIQEQLEAQLGVKLHADRRGDTVNGSLSILHQQPPLSHLIDVTLYEQDDPPSERHSAEFKASAVLPKQTDAEVVIDALPSDLGQTAPVDLAKESAREKLKALGFTDDEIAAIR